MPFLTSQDGSALSFIKLSLWDHFSCRKQPSDSCPPPHVHYLMTEFLKNYGKAIDDREGIEHCDTFTCTLIHPKL